MFGAHIKDSDCNPRYYGEMDTTVDDPVVALNPAYRPQKNIKISGGRPRVQECIKTDIFNKEMNYESYDDCFSFWQRYSFLLSYDDPNDEKVKCIVYNLTAMQKYFLENGIGEYIRGLRMGLAILTAIKLISEGICIRIASPEKAFDYISNRIADDFYALPEGESFARFFPDEVVRIVDDMIEIIKKEQ